MSGIHELWRSATALAEQRGPRVEKPETIAHHTHHKAVIVCQSRAIWRATRLAAL